MKNKNLEKAKPEESKGIQKSLILSFLEEREDLVAMVKGGFFRDTSIPLTIRLNENDYAFLVMLAKKYCLSKSAMASELLRNALAEVIRSMKDEEYSKMLHGGQNNIKALLKKRGITIVKTVK